ncbi:MAG: hypothetical protein ACM3NQ_09015 [Bacteroidales bacterium]
MVPESIARPGDTAPKDVACPKCQSSAVVVATVTDYFVYFRCLDCAEIWAEAHREDLVSVRQRV